MKGLIIDNYDSFTYNLYQYFGELDSFQIDVVRNDKITLTEVKKRDYDYFIISPGPGHPAVSRNFGICTELLQTLSFTVPTLGICLGHQGIGHCFGAKIVKAKKPMHGKTSTISHDNKGIFTDIPQNIEVARYHSLIIDSTSFPSSLEISATTSNGEIMGIRHRKYFIEGIQFHPESILTFYGKKIIKNFLEMI